jgi:hypothetical protein
MSETCQSTKNDWLATKIDTGEAVKQYEFVDRAYKCHSQWMVGFDIDEIAAYFGITEAEVKLDLQHVQGNMTPAAMNRQFNERQRLRIQREQAYSYESLLHDSLKKTPDDYINKGMNPSGILREYREATGLTERGAGVSINFNRNTQNNIGAGFPNGGRADNGFGVKSMEDLVRLVIDQDPSCGLEPVAEDLEDQMLIESQASEPSDDGGDDEPEESVEESPSVENDDKDLG